jgi:hypothetical protein
MASGGDHGERLWGEDPSHDGRQSLSHRARMDAAPGWASSSTWWGFVVLRWLLGLASCRGVNSCLLIVVGLLLLHARQRHRRWPSSCRSSSYPERGSWIVEKAWRLPSTLLRGCAWNITPSASRLRLPSRTSTLGCVPLVLSLNILSTLTGCWRSDRSSFACRRQTWRCKR